MYIMSERTVCRTDPHACFGNTDLGNRPCSPRRVTQLVDPSSCNCAGPSGRPAPACGIPVHPRQNFAVVKFLPLDVLLGSISRTESTDVIALDGTTDRLVRLFKSLLRRNLLKGINCEM